MKLLFYITLIFRPSYWLMNYSYSSAWNAKINTLIESDKFTNIRQHTAKIGGVEVWIENHPYASFTASGFKTVRPSRYTIWKAARKLEHDFVDSL